MKIGGTVKGLEMAPFKFGKRDGNGDTKAEQREKRKLGKRGRGADARRGKRDGRRHTRDLYKTDLDRHLWSWASPSARKEREKKRRSRARRRKVAGFVASAAGMLGAAGLSYVIYRRLRKDEPDDR